MNRYKILVDSPSGHLEIETSAQDTIVALIDGLTLLGIVSLDGVKVTAELI